MTPARVAWTRRAITVFASWFLLCGLALFLGWEPQPVLLAAVVVATALTAIVYIDASAAAAGNRWAVSESDTLRLPGEDPRLAQLTRVVRSHLVSHDVGDQLYRELLRLLDQRLMARYGVSTHAGPEQVAELAGPELSALVRQTPPYPRLTLDQIDALIKGIEEL